MKNSIPKWANQNGERIPRTLEGEIDRCGYGNTSAFSIAKHSNNKKTIHYFNPLAFVWEKITLEGAKNLLSCPGVLHRERCVEMLKKHFPKFEVRKLIF